MSSLRSQLLRFNHVAARFEVDAWGGKATVSTDPSGTAHCFAMSAPRAERNAAEHGVGWQEQVVRTIAVRAAQGLTLALGTRFTIVEDPANPETVGTVWSIRRLPGSTAGASIHCLCFRLDPPN